MHWYLDVLKKYVDFNGRARRTEFWMFNLISVIISFLLAFIDMQVIKRPNTLAALYSLAVLLPAIAVSVRRLHDTGRSGWWYLLILVPCIGALVLLFWFVQDTQPGSNQYGPSPKKLAPSDF